LIDWRKKCLENLSCSDLIEIWFLRSTLYISGLILFNNSWSYAFWNFVDSGIGGVVVVVVGGGGIGGGVGIGIGVGGGIGGGIGGVGGDGVGGDGGGGGSGVGVVYI